MAAPLPPGVPALLRQPTTIAGITNAANIVSLIASDAALIRRFFDKPKWGLYRNGALYVQADSVVGMSYRQDSKISDYPQEEGSFQQYNKVGTPYDARLMLTKGGAEVDRTGFLNAIEAAANSLDLFDVVTPEKTYTNANVQRFDYDRKAASGAGLITVEIWLIQIRTTAQTKFTSTKGVSGASTVNAGTLQADNASPRLTSAAQGAQ